MKIIQTKSDLNYVLNEERNKGRKMAFVPTMGALHEGHLSLIDIARQNADFVIVSIFVNPTQFAPHEDFENYPRAEEDDAEQLELAGANILFLPVEGEIYPDGHESLIKAGEAKEGLETLFRPHFFDGVVNVVYRLFETVKPDIAVFGEKDFQQLQVIKEMVETLELPIAIIGAPIVRDSYGLALSSRNAYLSVQERETARKFNKVLIQAASDGDLDNAKKALLDAGFDKVDYVEKRWDRILGAGWIGQTRLIDNIPIK